jgi:hypothetical protein
MSDITLPKYHKIDSVFKRDPATKHRTFLIGQYAQAEFDYLSRAQWVATEKVDGTNCRIHIYHEPAMARDGFTVGGRTDNSQLHVELVNHLNEVGERAIHNLDISGLTLYGEGYGAGIQKGGGNYRSDKGFILFDVMVTETGVFLERENVDDIATQLDIPVVPFVWAGQLTWAVNRFADSYQVITSRLLDGEPEGWVLRPTQELRGRLGQRIITKIKVKDFPERNQT